MVGGEQLVKVIIESLEDRFEIEFLSAALKRLLGLVRALPIILLFSKTVTLILLVLFGGFGSLAIDRKLILNDFGKYFDNIHHCCLPATFGPKAIIKGTHFQITNFALLYNYSNTLPPWLPPCSVITLFLFTHAFFLYCHTNYLFTTD